MSTKALLVGINDYKPAGQGGPDLNGCINDVKDMANTLMILGYKPKNIKLLTNQNATESNMIQGLNWLVRDTKRGDELVFFYSGHGSQVYDMDWDENITDRKDEIICPFDIDFVNKIYITDDNLREILSKLPQGVNLEIILDCCHSGTGTREAIALDDLTQDQRVVTRYLEPPVDFTFNITVDRDLKSNPLLRSTHDRDVVIVKGINHTLWTACRDNQVSQETMIEGTVRGVFTYHFCKTLRRTNGNITRNKLEKVMSLAIRNMGFSQTPQLETSSPELMDKPFKVGEYVEEYEAESSEDEMF